MLFEDENVDNNITLIKYTCSKCGTSTFVSENINVVECPFCNSKEFNKDSYNSEKKIYILPFNKSIINAKEEYRRQIKNNLFIPFRFRRKTSINGINKIYIPALVSNVDVDGDVLFIGGEKQKNNKTTKTIKYQVLKNVHIHYNSLLSPSYNLISEKIFASVCKYDFRFLEMFDGKMNDYYVLDNDNLMSSLGDKTKEKVMKYSLGIVRDSINHPLKKLYDNKINVDLKDTKEVLLPIYFLNIKYKKKNYLYLMNGQNGSSILEPAFSKLIILIYGSFIFVIVFVITFLIAYFI